MSRPPRPRTTVTLHLDLPAGTPTSEVESLWSDCFEPLLGALHHLEAARVGLVLAGDLLPTLEERYPEGIAWLTDLSVRGQIELVATALHEPVLSAIPERDAIGQILAHATLLRRLFGRRPHGCWLPHGVWDPAVPRVLDRAGISYTFIEDRIVSGVLPEGAPVHGVHRTEREGCAVALLSHDARLAESIPANSVRQALHHLESAARRGDNLVPLALSAARFRGKAHQSWLATFLHALSQPDSPVQLRLPGEAVDESGSCGRIYLPSGGPREQLVPWERSLIRYEEANRLHKRMLRVSRTVERLADAVHQGDGAVARPDPQDLAQAARYLFRAQGAAVYSHYPHAGIYDARLRALVWRDLLRAERVALEAIKAHERYGTETVDVDCDGVTDVILRTPSMTAVVDRARSAGLIELSVHALARNVVDTITRRDEQYHALLALDEPDDDFVTEDAPTQVAFDEDEEALMARALAASPSAEVRRLSKALVTDRGPRVCFSELLISGEVTVHDLHRSRPSLVGRGLTDGPWSLVTAGRHGEDAVRAQFYRDATVSDPAGERPIRVHKRYTLRKEPTLDVRIEVHNRAHDPLRARIAVEVDLGEPAPGQSFELFTGDPRRSGRLVHDLGEHDRLSAEGGGLVLDLSTPRPARVWSYPIETVHHDGERMVVGHQGLCLVFVWPVELFGQEKAVYDLRLAVRV